MTEPAGMDPVFAAMTERSKTVLSRVLEECGVDVTRFFGTADSDVADEELRGRLGSAWAQHGRVCALKAQWKKTLAEREGEYDVAYANSYFVAGDILGSRATEGGKKNWILVNEPGIKPLDESVREAKYVLAMIGAAEKALESRANMLQSITKLAVSQLDKASITLRTGNDNAGRV